MLPTKSVSQALVRFLALLVLGAVVGACGPAPTPVVVEKEKVVEKPVIETVVVEKEKVVEKPVVQTVVVEKEKVVEKPVIQTVVVEKEVTRAEPKVLVIGHHLDPSTLDPGYETTAAYKSVSAATMEQLVIFSPDGGEIQPWLAESWSLSDDGMMLELKLKQGVKFHNGEEFNAEAAKFGIERWMSAIGYARWGVEDVERVEVVDDTTVAIHFYEPTGQALTALAFGCYVYPPEYYQSVGEEGFSSHPVGTGPYQFVEWVKDYRITFKAFPDYWGGPPKLDQIVWRVIPEQAARIAALEVGEVDLITNVAPGSIGRIQASPDLELVSSPGLRIFGTYLDSRVDHPIADRKVRRAMNYAVDKQTLVALFEGKAKPLNGQFMPPTILGYNPDVDPFEYNPEKAKELLAEAGYPDGFELPFKYTVGRYALDKEMGEAVAAYLEAIGIKVQLIPLEYGEFVRQYWEGGTYGEESPLRPAWQWGLLMPPDPHFIVGTGTAIKRCHQDPRAVELLEMAKGEVDPKKRASLYQEVMQIWNDDPTAIYLIIPDDLYAIRKGVTGFVPRIDQVVVLSDVGLAQ